MATFKKEKPSKGVATIPAWWIDMVPHDVLDREEDALKRKNASQEAAMYKTLAAKSEWETLNADSKYDINDNGELIDKESGKSIDTSGEKSTYQRDPTTGEWLKDGKSIFKSVPYVPFDNGDTVMYYGPTEPSSSRGGPEYGHKDLTFKKPDWMKIKLKATGDKPDWCK